MKRVSNKFRNSLRGVRRLSAIVGYYTDDSYFILTTEDNKKIQTEDGNNLVTTETGIVEYDEGVINNVNVLFNTSLFKTTCKYVQIDCNNKIDVGTKINVRIGVYIPEDDEFEYVNYGDYYIIDEPVYQADTKSYLITAYDKMIQSMVDYDSNPLNITYPITHKNLIKAICSKLGWEEELGRYPNYDKLITEDLYHDQELTYRDILDDLNSACGGSFMFSLDNQFIYKNPTETGLIIEDDDLKDTNVDFGKKYGPVNALTITSNDVVINAKEDTESIEENGKNELNISDTYLMDYDSETFIDDLFDEINGLEYNIFDVSSTGILILEPLDIFTFRHDGVDYKTIMFNDDIKLTQGLEETLYAEEPEENKNEYKVTNRDKKKLNQAIISLNKANAEIVLKVNSDGKIAQVRLDGDADEGTVIELDADAINLKASDILNLLAGNEINLTANNININSTNFKVDKDGNIIATSGTFGGTVNTSENLTVGNNAYIGQNQSGTSIDRKYIYLSEHSYIYRIKVVGTEMIGLVNDGNGFTTLSSGNSSVEANGDSINIYVNNSGSKFQMASFMPDSIYFAVTPNTGSDIRLKDEIKDIDTSFIDDLKVKEFEYKKIPGKKQIGLIAQDYLDKEYSKYFLGKTKQDDEEYYSIAYGNITNALIQYCQEMKKEIKSLKKEIEDLKYEEKL